MIIPAQEWVYGRHGQSASNAAKVIAGGRVDTPLTAQGIVEAKTMAAAVARLVKAQPRKQFAIYHSNLSRSRDTARFAAEAAGGLAMIERVELRERDWGGWSGLPLEPQKTRAKNGEVPPDGESNLVFLNRVNDALVAILEEAAVTGSIPIIIAHRGNMSAFLRHYGRQGEVGNCELYSMKPIPATDGMPWQITHYDAANETPVIFKTFILDKSHGAADGVSMG